MFRPDLEDLVHIAAQVLGGEPAVREAGLPGLGGRPSPGTCVRPGRMPVVPEKSAALLRSVARNDGLVGGNERLALPSAIAFLELNGPRPVPRYDAANDMVIAAAAGEIDDAARIAGALVEGSAPWC